MNERRKQEAMNKFYSYANMLEPQLRPAGVRLLSNLWHFNAIGRVIKDSPKDLADKFHIHPDKVEKIFSVFERNGLFEWIDDENWLINFSLED